MTPGQGRTRATLVGSGGGGGGGGGGKRALTPVRLSCLFKEIMAK